jgi:predicted esterase
MLTFHFESDDDIPENIIDSVKAAFRSKAITIVVEETDVAHELTDEMKSVLDQRIAEPKINYISMTDS